MPLINGKYYSPKEMNELWEAWFPGRKFPDDSVRRILDGFEPDTSDVMYFVEELNAFVHSPAWQLELKNRLASLDATSIKFYDPKTDKESWAVGNREEFYITLWAGTKGIGLRKDGTSEDLERTKEEAWADFLAKKPEKEEDGLHDTTEYAELVEDFAEVPKIQTVTADGGTIPVVAFITVAVSIVGAVVKLLL